MSDTPRSSPWIPVNGLAPATQGSPASPETVLPVRSPVVPPAQPEPETVVHDHTAYPLPDGGTNAVRRAPALSPYFAPRDADGVSRPAPAAVPMLTPEEPPTAYAAPQLGSDASASWAPMRPVGVDPTYAAAASASPVGVTKPAQPVVTGSSRIPQPIEIEDPEVIRPVAAPPAHEILPTTGSIPVVGNPPGSVAMGAPAFEPGHADHDPVRLLGATAVTAASLDAAGARTPASGIPLPVGADALPTFGLNEEFIPRFEPESPLGPVGAPTRVPLTGEQPRVSFTQASGTASAPSDGLAVLAPVPQPAVPENVVPPAAGVAAAWATVADEIPPHPAAPDATPVVNHEAYSNTGSMALTVAPAPPGPPATPDSDEDRPRRGRRWLWIALAVLGGVALGVVVYRLFFLPEPIILPAPVVTEAAPTPTIEPVDIVDASDFLAGMPTEIGTFVLTSYEVVEVIGDETLPTRAAEHLILTYGESSGDAHFTVNAYQFYNLEDAATAFAVWSDGATATDDVVVDGVAVGERAVVTSGTETSVVWSNGTGVFVLDGPPDEVEQFYAYFGI